MVQEQNDAHAHSPEDKVYNHMGFNYIIMAFNSLTALEINMNS